METLDEVPAHVWKGLPPGLSLGPSAVDQSRVGESTTPPPVHVRPVLFSQNKIKKQDEDEEVTRFKVTQKTVNILGHIIHPHVYS